MDESGSITLTVSGAFADVDGSESHALSIPVPAGWSIVGTGSDWTQDPLTGVLELNLNANTQSSLTATQATVTIVPTTDDAIHRADDVSFTVTDEVTDANAPGDGGTSDAPQFFFSNANVPVSVVINPIGATDTVLGLSAETVVDEGGSITLTVSGAFADVDGSESHALSIPVPAGWSIVGTGSDWTQDPLTGVLELNLNANTQSSLTATQATVTIVPTTDDAIHRADDVSFTVTDEVTDANAPGDGGTSDAPQFFFSNANVPVSVIINPIAAGDTSGLSLATSVNGESVGDIDEDTSVDLTVHADFADRDGSESHVLTINVPTGWTLTSSPEGWSEVAGAGGDVWQRELPANVAESFEETITVAPGADSNIDVSFTLTDAVTDANASGDLGTSDGVQSFFSQALPLVVNAVNDRPVADDIPVDEATEDTDQVITLSAFDADLDPALNETPHGPLTFLIASTPSDGRLFQVEVVEGVAVRGDPIFAFATGTQVEDAGGRVIFVPNKDANSDEGGSFDFFFQVVDPTGLSDIGSVSVTVAAENDAPVAANVSFLGLAGVTEDDGAPKTLSFDAFDVDNAVLTYSFDPTTGPAKGSVVIDDANSGTFTFDPAGAFESLAAGTSDFVSFDYQVSDGELPSEVRTVTIEVSGVNDAPTAKDVNESVSEDGPGKIFPAYP